MEPVLLLQFVLLAGTALVWWFARRDLTQLAAQFRAGETEELERLRAGVEDLAADLERRAEAAESRLAARIAQARALSPSPDTPAPPELGAGGRPAPRRWRTTALRPRSPWPPPASPTRPRSPAARAWAGAKWNCC